MASWFVAWYTGMYTKFDAWLLSNKTLLPPLDVNGQRTQKNWMVPLAFFGCMFIAYLGGKYISDIVEGMQWRRDLRARADARMKADEAAQLAKNRAAAPSARAATVEKKTK